MQLEDAPFDGGPVRITIQGEHSLDEITYHVMLLHQAGLIEAFDFSSDEMASWLPGYLTWQGHEFLEAARDDGRWNRTKALIKSRGGTMVFEVVKSVLIETLKQQVSGQALK